MTGTWTTPIRQWRVDVEDYVQVLEVNRDRGQAVVGSLGGDAALIDIDDGSAIALGRHEMGVMSAAWSTDGTRVGATAYGGIGWHDVIGPRTGRRRRFDWKGSLLALVMSPDGSWACAGAQDATVHLWRLWSGRDLSMSGYPSKIERLGFRHDSRWLAVACLEELTVWDFGGRGPAGTEPAVASGHDNHIEDVAWDPSGRSVATGGGDGRTIVWAAPNRAGEDLSPVTALESDAATSRLRWVDEDSLLVGRADGSLVKLAL